MAEREKKKVQLCYKVDKLAWVWYVKSSDRTPDKAELFKGSKQNEGQIGDLTIKTLCTFRKK